MTITNQDKIREARSAHYAAVSHLKSMLDAAPVYEDHQEELDGAYQAIEDTWQAWKRARAEALEAPDQA